jgi:hypothetical protein
MVTPEFNRTISYTFFTDDLQVLLVDDDGAEAYEDYFIDALEYHGYTYGMWNRGAGAPTDAILAYFPAVVWSCGWAFPTVDADDRAALSAYLDNGGKLFITGQDIGWEMNDEGGAAYQWYQNYLHAIYINDDTNDYTLDGVPGDPITDNLDIVIQGGDGANNQEYPSDIDPADGSATIIWTYDALRNGALRADTGTYRVVYLAFGYEAIDNAADRRAALHRSLAWLMQDPADVADAGASPRAFFSSLPNPVTSSTTLRFTLPSSGEASLKLYGPDGRVLRTLIAGDLEAGTHVIDWDRTGSRGERLPAGVYYYRLQGTGVDLTQKAVLLR